MSGPWPERPEAAVVRNPHQMRLGRAMHIYTKLEGEWVCSVCWPERFKSTAGPVTRATRRERPGRRVTELKSGLRSAGPCEAN